MSAAPVKNIAASVKNRLLAAARQSGMPFEGGERHGRRCIKPARSDARRDYHMIRVSLAVLTITSGRLTIGLRIPYKHLSAFDALVRPRKSVD